MAMGSYRDDSSSAAVAARDSQGREGGGGGALSAEAGQLIGQLSAEVRRVLMKPRSRVTEIPLHSHSLWLGFLS
eukprot:COSAG01_NODE_3183_length_6447_cov_3.930687_11_plen_74_part_00